MARNVRVVVLIGVVVGVLCGVASTAGQVNRRRPATRSAPLDEVAAAVFPNLEALGRAAESFAKAKQTFAEVSRDIAAARKAFWTQYPNGPRRAETEAAFARELQGKDFALLTATQLGQRCRNATPNAQAMNWLVSAVGVDVDGGVAPTASTTFCRWAEAVGWTMASSAVKHPFYESYRRDRDWYEFYRAGEVAFGSIADFHTSTDVRWYVLGLVWSGTDGDVIGPPVRPASFPDQIERAQQKVDALAEAYGREKVFSVATRVMQAPKTPVEPNARYSYRLANAPALGCPTKPVPDVAVCFNHLVGVYEKRAVVLTDAERSEWAAVSRSSNPRDYVRFIYWMYLKDQTNLGPLSTPDTRRRQVDDLTSRFIAFWREAPVLDAARRIQAAPKDAQGLIGPETAKQIGCARAPGEPVELIRCLEGLVSAPPPRAAAPPAATPVQPANPAPAVDASKPGPADASYRQGLQYLGSGQFPEAQKHFEAAIATDPRHAESHYQLGLLCYQTGALARARVALQTYLELAPNGPNAESAKNFLKIVP